MKKESEDHAKELFQGTGIAITSEGKRHLGSAIGSSTFVEWYVKEKISGWKKEIDRLSEIAKTQPQAAYAAFSHRLASKWTYLARTTPDIDVLFKPLEEAIRYQLLPAITGQMDSVIPSGISWEDFPQSGRHNEIRDITA